jgi:hypothetical protein
MDRKSFFKNALLAVGATIVPNVILKAIRPSRKIYEGLFVQLDKSKFYWMEWQSDNISIVDESGESYPLQESEVVNFDGYKDGKAVFSTNQNNPFEERLRAVKTGNFIRNTDGTISFHADINYLNKNG